MASMTDGVPGNRERALQILREVDLEQFFTALPVQEFEAILEDRQERLDMRRKQLEAAQVDIEKLGAEIDAIKQALRARAMLLETAATQDSKPREPTRSVVPFVSAKRKRAAVLEIMREHPGELLSPGDVRSALASRGLIDPEHEQGTPIRVVLAHLTTAGQLDRPKSGHYRFMPRPGDLQLEDINRD